jgi:dTDP-4-dehydrorhamnose 3,5-epimerase
MLISRGFAHCYLTLEDDILMQWCVDNDFYGAAAKTVRYDSEFSWQTNPWPVMEYILSEKDKKTIQLGKK